jgi:predicted metal-dependent hydrolase
MANSMYLINIDGHKIPFKIIEERRNGARVALASQHVILRVPKAFLIKTDVKKHLDWAINWIKNLQISQPNVLDKYKQLKLYSDGDVFIMGRHSFTISILLEDRETGKIKLINDQILQLSIPTKGDYNQQKLIKNLLIKFSQRYFQSLISERVNYYNDLYFQKPINSVKLKYNKSNWGSCSTSKNLNFSVRLFFAPDAVIDYVVIHELAHLIEMNHSDRFWQIVKKIMPNYQKAEKDLKVNGGKYDF